MPQLMKVVNSCSLFTMTHYPSWLLAGLSECPVIYKSKGKWRKHKKFIFPQFEA